MAQASRRFVVVVDLSKMVDRLGSHVSLPVEVVRFGHVATARRIAALGGAPVLRVPGGAPFVTDGGNLIYDCHGFRPILDPCILDGQLKVIAGVMETGLFLNSLERCILGAKDGSVTVLLPAGTIYRPEDV